MGNVFKALGIQTREDSVSNAIVYAFNQSQYNGYKLRRDKFIYALKKQKLNYNWQFTGRTNQIARLDLSFSGYTSQRAKDKIEEVLKDMTRAIDNVLKMMYNQGYFVYP